MRVLLFSPVGPRSSIARVTGLVTRAMLDQGHLVSIVQSEDVPAPSERARGLEDVVVLPWTDRSAVLDAAQRADGVVYQIGDHYGFHRGALEWLPVVAGTVCLHDFYLADLFHAWAQRDRPYAERILATWYGADPSEFFRFACEPDFVSRTAHSTPMTEWVASMADAVVTHSSWGLDRVLNSCAGPIRVLPLPYEPFVAVGHQGAQIRRPGDEFSILTYGWIVSNKRAESVIEAIGADPLLKERATYRLVGPIEPEQRDRLSTLSARLGVRTVISGEVTDVELSSALSQADVVCCLRTPTLEAASASTIEALLCAKPVIVVDAGFYSELPNSIVLKISPEREIPDLREQLRRVESAPAEASALGAAAAKWARSTFRADRYAASLVDVVQQAAIARPLLDATWFAVQTLVSWGGAEHAVLTEPTISPLADIAKPGPGW